MCALQRVRQPREARGGKRMNDGQNEDGGCDKIEWFELDPLTKRRQERGGGRRVRTEGPRENRGWYLDHCHVNYLITTADKLRCGA
jgi:hypothetical protein